MLLRSRRVAGHKFRRQHSLGPYVADFYCPTAGLVIELDGDAHARPLSARRDDARTRWLESRGLRVVRLSNRDVLTRADGVLETLLVLLGEP